VGTNIIAERGDNFIDRRLRVQEPLYGGEAAGVFVKISAHKREQASQDLSGIEFGRRRLNSERHGEGLQGRAFLTERVCVSD